MPRPRLLDRLAESATAKLTLISAPPGYGKTTLVSHWLEQLETPYAWLSLDERDADLATFASYLVGAVRTVYPASLPTISAALDGSSVSDPLRLADILLMDLEQLDSPLSLVLDDFHTVQIQPVLAFLGRMLQHLPEEMRLIVITRSDPPLPLALLRARQQLTEIRTSDLRFSETEARPLLERMIGRMVPGEIATLLVQRTEGWPVGLQLAGLSLRESDDPTALAQRFARRNDRLVAEYLADEALNPLPEHQRRLVIRLAVLDEICGPLCEVLAEGQLQPGDGETLLQTLWQSNLFLVALAEEGRWYRFHQLFLDLLRHQLQRLETQESIADMYRLASTWCAANRLAEEAISYSVRAGDAIGAARLVEQHLPEALNREDFRQIERWLRALPETVLPRPGILIAQAFTQHFRFRNAAMQSLVEEAESALATDLGDYSPVQARTLQGSINTLRAVAASRTATAHDGPAYAALALQQLPAEMSFARSLAENHYLLALQRAGRRQEAVELAQNALARQIGAPDARTPRLLLALCNIHYAEANLRALHAAATNLQNVAQENGLLVSLGWANACLGWVHYQRDDLALAEQYFRKVMDHRHAIHGRCALDSLTGLALTLHALEQDVAAQAIVEDLHQLLLDRSLINYMPFADALAIFLDPEPGEATLSESYSVDPDAQIANNLWLVPALVATRVHLNNGALDDLEAAAALLHSCRAAAESRHSNRHLIEIGALEARLHAALGQQQAALAALRQSVILGEPGGALRLIADAGPELRPLLHELQDQGVAPDYIERILAARCGPKSAPALRYLLPPPNSEPAGELTNREMDVLLLLERRLTNKEIAGRLGVTPDTVKKHARSVFRKLGSKNRRQAVARARELGLLPPLPSVP